MNFTTKLFFVFTALHYSRPSLADIRAVFDFGESSVRSRANCEELKLEMRKHERKLRVLLAGAGRSLLLTR